MTENKITCDSCGKEVQNSWDLDRWGIVRPVRLRVRRWI